MSSICDSCRRNNDCLKPMDGLDWCKFHISNAESNYQHLFGTPEKMTEYIIKHCYDDCIACMMPAEIPCYRSFEDVSDYYNLILDWLNETYS